MKVFTAILLLSFSYVILSKDDCIYCKFQKPAGCNYNENRYLNEYLKNLTDTIKNMEGYKLTISKKKVQSKILEDQYNKNLVFCSHKCKVENDKCVSSASFWESSKLETDGQIYFEEISKSVKKYPFSIYRFGKNLQDPSLNRDIIPKNKRKEFLDFLKAVFYLENGTTLNKLVLKENGVKKTFLVKKQQESVASESNE